MIANLSDTEYFIARKTAEEYRSKGYEVAQEYPLEFFPGFLADLVVRKGGEAKVIEIRRRSSLAADPRIRKLSEIIDSKPGWSFDLILVGEPERLDSPEGAQPFVNEDIIQRIRDAESALDAGLREAALLLAWSALEASARVLIDAQGVANSGVTKPEFVLEQAVSLGVLSREGYSHLTHIQKYRNSIVHGFTAPDLSEELVTDLIETARLMAAPTP